MHSITLRVPFCAAHRILGHTGRCRHLHGHNYVATVTVTPTERTEVVTKKVGKKGTKEEEVTVPAGLDKLGMVMDFADLKEVVKGWIDEHWDHNTILKADDPLVEAINQHAAEVSVEDDQDGEKEVYAMSGERNATAESMAEELCEQVTELLLDQFVRVTQVTIEETDGCSATFVPDEQSGSGGDEDDLEDEDEDEDEDEEDEEEEEEPPTKKKGDAGGDEGDLGEEDRELLKKLKPRGR